MKLMCSKVVQYTGPSIDIKMFEYTKWEYFDGTESDPVSFPYVISPSKSTKLEILKRLTKINLNS